MSPRYVQTAILHRCLPTLATTDQMGDITWEFFGPNDESRAVVHKPRMCCVDFGALRNAAVAGLGVALLPTHACTRELANGNLVRVFPQWQIADGIIHLVFTTRPWITAGCADVY